MKSNTALEHSRFADCSLSQAGLLALPILASLPIPVTGAVAYNQQRCLLQRSGVGITAAGPLLNSTGFPFKSSTPVITPSLQDDGR